MKPRGNDDMSEVFQLVHGSSLNVVLLDDMFAGAVKNSFSPVVSSPFETASLNPTDSCTQEHMRLRG